MIRGWSSEALLDTYELERRPYSLELIEFDKEIELKLSGSDGQDVERYAEYATTPRAKESVFSHQGIVAYGVASSCS